MPRARRNYYMQKVVYEKFENILSHIPLQPREE